MDHICFGFDPICFLSSGCQHFCTLDTEDTCVLLVQMLTPGRLLLTSVDEDIEEHQKDKDDNIGSSDTAPEAGLLGHTFEPVGVVGRKDCRCRRVERAAGASAGTRHQDEGWQHYYEGDKDQDLDNLAHGLMKRAGILVFGVRFGRSSRRGEEGRIRSRLAGGPGCEKAHVGRRLGLEDLTGWRLRRDCVTVVDCHFL